MTTASLISLVGRLFAVRPHPLPVEQVATAVHAHYRLEGRYTPLGSERDQNFHLDTDAGKFVVKISHPGELPAVADLQCRLLDHLAGHTTKVNVPRLVRTTTGAPTVRLETQDGSRLLRIVTFLPGTLMHKVPATPRLLHSLGAAAASLDRVLGDFSHREKQEDLLWNLLNFPRMQPLLETQSDDPDAEAMVTAMANFQERIVPNLPSLEWGFIHNDLNPHNILVDGEHVCGLIDFGDTVHAPRLCELAVLAAYQIGTGGLHQSGLASCVEGYDSVLPLTGSEIELLPTLIAARLAMTVLITEHRALEDGQNRDYILRNNEAARRGLRVLNGSWNPASPAKPARGGRSERAG